MSHINRIQARRAYAPLEVVKKIVRIAKNGLKIRRGFREEKVGILLFDGLHRESLSEKLAMPFPCCVAWQAGSGEVGLCCKYEMRLQQSDEKCIGPS